MSNIKDELGDRLKKYEAVSTNRIAFKGQPLVARLDGKSFHTFSKDLQKPFDSGLTKLMQETTKHVVEKFGASVGYTQSDEITLAWYVPIDSMKEYIFNGRFQKLDSILAAYTSVAFNKLLPDRLPEKTGLWPIFDCRTFIVPDLSEAYHVFLWRQQDAVKNAISAAAHSMFDHGSLQGLHSNALQLKMLVEKGVNFNDYPDFFKRGTFCKKIKVEKKSSPETLAKIKPENRPTGPVFRSQFVFSNEWLTKLEDPIGFLFSEC